MVEKDKKGKHYPALVRLSDVVIAAMVLIAGTAAAQDSPLVAPQSASATPAIQYGIYGGGLPSPTQASVASRRWLASDAPVVEFAGAPSAEGNALHSGVRRITLEQVKQQQFVASNPLAKLAELSIEAAKQHRLGAQADYFPKISATVANLHYSEFLGQVISFRHPLEGSTVEVPVPLLTQNQTITAITFVQPITPLFQVYQLVQIARADERIAIAKAGASAARNASSTQIEEVYFKLLIAQRQSISAELRLRSSENRPAYASASSGLILAPVHMSGQESELEEARKALVTADAKVRELKASLNRVMGWPEDTDLELATPDPLVENISLQEIADKSAATNPEVIEAEQTAVKARAASTLSKLAYVPAVAATSGFIYQNASPLLPNTFGYGGVMVSYNIFDFGKRERAVKEATVQLEMAEMAIGLTKAKIAADVKKTYYELERSRQLSQLAQQMGSSVTRLMNVSSTSESIDVKAARAKVEVEMLEAELAHRQAFARLEALTGSSHSRNFAESQRPTPEGGLL